MQTQSTCQCNTLQETCSKGRALLCCRWAMHVSMQPAWSSLNHLLLPELTQTSATLCADGKQEAQLETVERVDSRASGAGEAASSSPAVPPGGEGRVGRGSALQESDAAYLLKLLFVSVGGAGSSKAFVLQLVAPSWCSLQH